MNPPTVSGPLVNGAATASPEPPAAAGKRRRRRRKRLLPGLIRAKAAAGWCGAALRTWRAWDASGKVPRPVRIGGAVLWRLAELRDWAEAGCPDRRAWEALAAQRDGRPR
jgi:predicted DNA-binding transcriptional regulator AlpA